MWATRTCRVYWFRILRWCPHFCSYDSETCRCLWEEKAYSHLLNVLTTSDSGAVHHDYVVVSYVLILHSGVRLRWKYLRQHDLRLRIYDEKASFHDYRRFRYYRWCCRCDPDIVLCHNLQRLEALVLDVHYHVNLCFARNVLASRISWLPLCERKVRWSTWGPFKNGKVQWCKGRNWSNLLRRIS